MPTSSGILNGLLRRCSGSLETDELEKRILDLTLALPCRHGFTSWSSLCIDAGTKTAVEAARQANKDAEILLGRIDDDGRLLTKFGALPGLPPVSEVDFVERKRFSLDVVLSGDALLIRKDYRGDRTSFVREWAGLAMLAGKVNVPGIHRVDAVRAVILKNLILGKTIRELLVAEGAKILHAHTRNDPALAGLKGAARIEAVWLRGQKSLPAVVNREFLARLQAQLHQIHLLGISGVSLTWGNVVVGEGTSTPWLIDLDKARIARSQSSTVFRVRRYRDQKQFESIYGRPRASCEPFRETTNGLAWRTSVSPGPSENSMERAADSAHRTVARNGPSSSYLIATSWHDKPVSQQFRALGAELASRGHRVVLLIDRHNRAVEKHSGNPVVFTWPSHRPTRFRDAWFLSRIVRKHRPDCLVSNFGAVNLMTLIGWCHGVKHRVAWHHTLSSAIDVDTMLPPWKLTLLRWRKRRVWRFATAIAAVSGAAREDLHTRFGVPEAKCHVIYNSLEDPLRGNHVPKTLSGDHRILCVGRFDSCKGQDVLLRGLALLRRDLPQVHVEFLGEGPQRAECERIAGELGLSDCSHFAGSVAHNRVLEAMVRADVTVVPSRHEAFGLVALESIAVGTPVVASSVGGLPEVLGDALGTLLVPPDDPEALAGTLRQLLTNARGYPQLSERVRAQFLQEFEQGAAVKRQADWLESMVKTTKSSASIS